MGTKRRKKNMKATMRASKKRRQANLARARRVNAPNPLRVVVEEMVKEAPNDQE